MSTRMLAPSLLLGIASVFATSETDAFAIDRRDDAVDVGDREALSRSSKHLWVRNSPSPTQTSVQLHEDPRTRFHES